MFSCCVELNILNGIPEDTYPLKNVYYECSYTAHKPEKEDRLWIPQERYNFSI